MTTMPMPPRRRPGGLARALVLSGVAILFLALAALVGCERESRRFEEIPPTAMASGLVRQVVLQPGIPTKDLVAGRSSYDENAWAIGEGYRLFNQFNCSGCHGTNGGGGMGPPLMDDQWIYGSDPENIVATIMEGRPNGMPSFRGRVSTQQAYELASYIRSLSGITPFISRPSRSDHMMGTGSMQMTSAEKPKHSFVPKSTEMP